MDLSFVNCHQPCKEKFHERRLPGANQNSAVYDAGILNQEIPDEKGTKGESKDYVRQRRRTLLSGVNATGKNVHNDHMPVITSVLPAGRWVICRREQSSAGNASRLQKTDKGGPAY